MTACCQIICTIPWLPCEQLPYPPKHLWISQIRQRDKSKLPLLTSPYKYYLPWYSSFILSSCILNPSFLAMALFEKLKNSSEDILQRLFEPSISSSFQEEMAINFVIPNVNSALPFSFLPYFWFLHGYLFGIFSFYFLCFSNLQSFRNWSRKLSSPLINPTFNALVYWGIRILPIW